MKTIPDLLKVVCRDGSATLIEDETEAVTRGEFLTLAGEARAGLQEMGVVEGDRLLFAAPNSVRFAAALLGALELGAVVCPVHPENGRIRLRYFAENTEAVGAVVDSARQDKFHSATEIRAYFRLDQSRHEGKVRQRRARNDHNTQGLAAILHTSGSTGVPNGVKIGHSQAIFATRAISGVLGVTSSDAIYCGLPLSFDYGLYQLFIALMTGARLVIRRDFHLPPAIPRDLVRTRATVFPAVPSLISALLKSGLLERVELPDLRLVTTTGDALPLDHWTRLCAALPVTEVVRMYGLTECKRVSIMPPGKGAERPESVGLPLPGTKAWVEKRRGVAAGLGETGELVVSGPNVMDGYWNNPGATKRKFKSGPEGWGELRTGDLFRMDEEGYLYFVARKGKMIKTSANAVSPLEVENFLTGLATVSEAAVVSLPDRDRGGLVCAALAVTRTSTLDAEKVRSLCSENLSPHCVPALVKFYPAGLPKTENGKIHRKVIRSNFVKG